MNKEMHVEFDTSDLGQVAQNRMHEDSHGSSATHSALSQSQRSLTSLEEENGDYGSSRVVTAEEISRAEK